MAQERRIASLLRELFNTVPLTAAQKQDMGQVFKEASAEYYNPDTTPKRRKAIIDRLKEFKKAGRQAPTRSVRVKTGLGSGSQRPPSAEPMPVPIDTAQTTTADLGGEATNVPDTIDDLNLDPPEPPTKGKRGRRGQVLQAGMFSMDELGRLNDVIEKFGGTRVPYKANQAELMSALDNELGSLVKKYPRAAEIRALRAGVASRVDQAVRGGPKIYGSLYGSMDETITAADARATRATEGLQRRERMGTGPRGQAKIAAGKKAKTARTKAFETAATAKAKAKAATAAAAVRPGGLGGMWYDVKDVKGSLARQGKKGGIGAALKSPALKRLAGPAMLVWLFMDLLGGAKSMAQGYGQGMQAEEGLKAQAAGAPTTKQLTDQYLADAALARSTQAQARAIDPSIIQTIMSAGRHSRPISPYEQVLAAPAGAVPVSQLVQR